jgi:hypothetical protein
MILEGCDVYLPSNKSVQVKATRVVTYDDPLTPLPVRLCLVLCSLPSDCSDDTTFLDQNQCRTDEVEGDLLRAPPDPSR